jgi:hypothetical protein
VPTLGLMSARALEKLGRWVEASERYLEVSRAKVEPKALPAMRRAPAEAAHDRAALLPRIPTLEIQVENADPVDVTLTIDGHEAKSAMIGVPLPMDPGEHVVRAVRGEDVAEARVTLRDGEPGRVAVRLPVRAASPESVASAPEGDRAAPTSLADEPSSTQRTIGWSVVALGGAGIAFGAVTGGLAVAKRSDLDDAGCRDGICPPSVSGDVDRYGALRTMSTIGFIAGSASAALGALLVLTAPRAKEPAHAALSPWIGAGSAGVRGRF